MIHLDPGLRFSAQSRGTFLEQSNARSTRFVGVVSEDEPIYQELRFTVESSPGARREYDGFNGQETVCPYSR